jgi:hypothetical protein
VRVIITEKKSLSSTMARHPSVTEIKTGGKRDGTLCASQIKLILNTGAYSKKGPTVTRVSTLADPGFPKFFKIFAEAEGDEKIVWATVNFDTLAHARRIFRVKKAGNWKLIADEYQKLAKKAGEKG